MRFGVLGPLLVHDGDAEVAVAAPRQRALLAALLVRAPQTVPAGALAETLWDGCPPAGAEATLRSYVMRLRRVMGPGPGARVVTRYPGYRLDAGPHEVDLQEFADLCGRGAGALHAGDWEHASAVLGQALGLWRGTPLEDVPGSILQRNEVPGLEQARLQALEWRTEARLHLGADRALVAELQSLTAENPLRERFHAQLMLALYRSGRSAEALAAYERARQILVDELGVGPGPELRQRHQHILAGDPSLALPGPAPTLPTAPVAAVPRELPASVAHFTGRTAELARLTGLLPPAVAGAPGAVVISAIGGTPGVGKTALAVHWARQVASGFPDGQLYVNLRGYDPDQPVSAADALGRFLRSLGVPGQEIPAEEADRASLYRSLLARSRILVVLDNARSAAQVRPLLPGSPASMVVVTSRDSLPGLVAREGAQRLDLSPLPAAEAVQLLRVLIGARVDADPSAARELAAQCSSLPLALRVAAELAATRPTDPLARVVDQLADQERRLDALDIGPDAYTAIRTVFSWSYRHLDPEPARAFQLLGLHPGPDLDVHAAAALTGSAADRARPVLAALTRANLIQPAGAGRYAMHDLMRAYAREQTDAEAAREERQSALGRLLRHYLHIASAAMDLLYPAERHRRPQVPAADGAGPPVADPVAARAWLDAERGNLVSCVVYAAHRGWPRQASQLDATVARYLHTAGYYTEASAAHAAARHAAGQLGDRIAEANVLRNQGAIDWRQGRYQQAADCYEQALTLFRAAADHAGEARALHNLGNVEFQRGRYQQAADRNRQALSLYRQAGDRTGEARTLTDLGLIDLRQGRYQQSESYLQLALALFREISDPSSEGLAIANLGDAALRQGRYGPAAQYLQQALDLFREASDRSGEGYALLTMGDLHSAQGQHQQAGRCHQQALSLFSQTGDTSGQAEALNGIGEARLVAGHPREASARHLAALSLAERSGDQSQQARAHHGLARACQARGDLSRAHAHWQEALVLYTSLGVPQADVVRTDLAQARREHPA